MIRLRLQEILGERNKTVYWLARHTSVTAPALYRIAHGKTAGIDFTTLDEICEALECKLSELLVRDEDMNQ